jgi:hypothetical protein
MIRLPDPLEHPTLPVWPWLGLAFDRKRSAVQELCRMAVNGHPEVLPIRVLRVGKSYRVATTELRGVLGLDSECGEGAPAGALVSQLDPATTAEDRLGS